MNTLRQLLAVPFYLAGALFLKIAGLIDGPEGRVRMGKQLREALR